MKMLRMINTLNSDSNVVEIKILFSDYYRLNDEIVTMMMNRFSNL